MEPFNKLIKLKVLNRSWEQVACQFQMEGRDHLWKLISGLTWEEIMHQFVNQVLEQVREQLFEIKS